MATNNNLEDIRRRLAFGQPAQAQEPEPTEAPLMPGVFEGEEQEREGLAQVPERPEPELGVIRKTARGIKDIGVSTVLGVRDMVDGLQAAASTADPDYTMKAWKEGRLPHPLSVEGKKELGNTIQQITQATGKAPTAEEQDAIIKSMIPMDRVQQAAFLGDIANKFPTLDERDRSRFLQAMMGMSRFAPSMAATATSGPVGFGVTFSQLYGSGFRKYKEEGHDTDTANEAAFTSALLSAPVELAGNMLQLKMLKPLAKSLGLTKGATKNMFQFATKIKSKLATTGMAKSTGMTIAQALATGAGRTAIGGASEATEEFVQAYTEAVGDVIANNKDMPAGKKLDAWIEYTGTDEFRKNRNESAALGAIGGVFLGGAGQAVNTGIEVNKAITDAKAAKFEAKQKLKEAAKEVAPAKVVEVAPNQGYEVTISDNGVMVLKDAPLPEHQEEHVKQENTSRVVSEILKGTEGIVDDGVTISENTTVTDDQAAQVLRNNEAAQNRREKLVLDLSVTDKKGRITALQNRNSTFDSEILTAMDNGDLEGAATLVKDSESDLQELETLYQGVPSDVVRKAELDNQDGTVQAQRAQEVLEVDLTSRRQKLDNHISEIRKIEIGRQQEFNQQLINKLDNSNDGQLSDVSMESSIEYQNRGDTKAAKIYDRLTELQLAKHHMGPTEFSTTKSNFNKLITLNRQLDALERDPNRQAMSGKDLTIHSRMKEWITGEINNIQRSKVEQEKQAIKEEELVVAEETSKERQQPQVTEEAKPIEQQPTKQQLKPTPVDREQPPPQLKPVEPKVPPREELVKKQQKEEEPTPPKRKKQKVTKDKKAALPKAKPNQKIQKAATKDQEIYKDTNVILQTKYVNPKIKDEITELLDKATGVTKEQLDWAKQNNIPIKFLEHENIGKVRGFTPGGSFDPLTKTIEINVDTLDTENTVNHEILHARIDNKLSKLSQVAQTKFDSQLKQLWNLVPNAEKQRGSKLDPRIKEIISGLDDGSMPVEEMITHMFTEKEFADWADSVLLSKAKAQPKESLWSRLKNWVLGIGNLNRSLLNVAGEIMDSFMNQAELTPLKNSRNVADSVKLASLPVIKDRTNMTFSPEIETDVDWLNTNDEKRSFLNRLHALKDQGDLNIDRLMQKMEQDFLKKFGGRKARGQKAGLAVKGHYRHTKESELTNKAMHLWIDSRDHTQTVDDYYNTLLKKDKLTHKEFERKQIIERMKELTTEEKAWTRDNIESWYKDIGKWAKENGLIENLVDNYVVRNWNIPKDWHVAAGGPTGGGVSLVSKHGKKRTLGSIVEGWQKGDDWDLKQMGAIPNLTTYMMEMNRASAYRRFVNYGKSIINTVNGQQILKENLTEQEAREQGYKELQHTGFKPFKKDGTKGTMWARADLADMINKATTGNRGDFWDVPFWKVTRRINSALKGNILGMSVFHHFAGVRSWAYGLPGQPLKDMFRPMKAYKSGLEKIQNEVTFGTINGVDYSKLGPVVDLGVRNGLTLGRIQDWEDFQDDSILTRAVKAVTTGGAKAVDVSRASDRVKRNWTNSLFSRLFAGLKAEAFAVEMMHDISKAQIKKGEGLTTEEVNTIAEKTAYLINADFGGQHLQRMGRNMNLQGFAQLILLSSDWCLPSNTRAMTKTGWKYHHELNVGDEILAFDKETQTHKWEPITYIYRNENYNGRMVTVPNHNRGITMTPHHRNFVWNISKKTFETVLADDLNTAHRIPRVAFNGYELPTEKKYSDEFIKLVGWFVTDGNSTKATHTLKDGTIKTYYGGMITQAKPKMVEEIKSICSMPYHTQKPRLGGINKDGKQIVGRYMTYKFMIPKHHSNKMRELDLHNGLNWEFLKDLTKDDMKLLYDTMMLGDGTGQGRFCGKQKEVEMMTLIQLLLGAPTTFYQQEENCWRSRWLKPSKNYISCSGKVQKVNKDDHYTGTIWCPKVESSYFVAESNGLVFVTGNTESNWRTVTGMIPGMNKLIDKAIGDFGEPKGMGTLYRKFWFNVAMRTAGSTMLANMAIGGLTDPTDDDDSIMNFYKKQFSSFEEFKRGRWTGIPITRFYKMLGVETHGDVVFSLGGHFFDPLKVLELDKLIVGKTSPLIRFVTEGFKGTDWRGVPFKGVTEDWINEARGLKDPKGGLLTTTTRFDKPRGFWDRAPAWLLHSMVTSLPIHTQEMSKVALGEEDILSGLLKTGGIHISKGTGQHLGQIKFLQTKKEIQTLEEAIDRAKANKQPGRAKSFQKQLNSMNKLRSKVGYTIVRLKPITKQIKDLKLVNQPTDRQVKQLKKLQEKRDKIFEGFLNTYNKVR